MAYAYPGAGALDYFPCRYGQSKMVFRGPGQRLDGRYCVALGGIETYGKFIAQPWPSLVEQATGRRMVNLGCVNAGLDAYVNDPGVMPVAARAEFRVVQLLGAQGLTNRFYAVHPRRNDRFLCALPPLQRLYPEIDFTEFNFVRHMVMTLARRDPDRFDLIAQELRAVWRRRMTQLLNGIGGPTALLWFSDRPPKPASAQRRLENHGPMLVDAAMVADLRPVVAEVIEVIAAPGDEPTAGAIHTPLDALAAAELPGPGAHERVAAAVLPVLAAFAPRTPLDRPV